MHISERIVNHVQLKCRKNDSHIEVSRSLAHAARQVTKTQLVLRAPMNLAMLIIYTNTCSVCSFARAHLNQLLLI